MHNPGPGPANAPLQTWQSEAANYFTRWNNWSLPWPLDTCLISERHRVLYTPIAKSACTSLKTMMVQLEGVAHSDEIIRLGVHQVIDVFNTGMLLKNLPLARAMEIIDAEDYYKFAVIRNPVTRAISAYTEKFVIGRMAPKNHLHTYQVVRSIQSGLEPDMDRGITFRQFVDYLIAQEPHTLDPHWLPQHHYLCGIPCYNRVYAVEQLDQLKTALENWTGTAINLGQLNASVSSRGDDRHTGLAADNAVDLFPAELEATGRLATDYFVDAELTGALKQYFAEDCALYEKALAAECSYRPARLLDHATLKSMGDNFSMGGDVSILSNVHVFSKGILGLQDNGSCGLGIAIINGNKIAINAAILPGLRVEYRIIDSDGQPLEPAPPAYPVETTVPAGETLRLALQLQLPLEWLEKAAKIQIVLTASADDGGSHNRLANIACADIMRIA
jgi:hypothetical protein